MNNLEVVQSFMFLGVATAALSLKAYKAKCTGIWSCVEHWEISTAGIQR